MLLDIHICLPRAHMCVYMRRDPRETRRRTVSHSRAGPRLALACIRGSSRRDLGAHVLRDTAIYAAASAAVQCRASWRARWHTTAFRIRILWYTDRRHASSAPVAELSRRTARYSSSAPGVPIALAPNSRPIESAVLGSAGWLGWLLLSETMVVCLYASVNDTCLSRDMNDSFRSDRN